MSNGYVINDDGTISRVETRASARPWFSSLTAAAVHSGAEITCFTKEGVRAEPFPNPSPDLVTFDPDAFVERHAYYVQMTEDGEIHTPPLSPREAAEWTSHLAVLVEDESFDYEPDNLIPEL